MATEIVDSPLPPVNVYQRVSEIYTIGYEINTIGCEINTIGCEIDTIGYEINTIGYEIYTFGYETNTIGYYNLFIIYQHEAIFTWSKPQFPKNSPTSTLAGPERAGLAICTIPNRG